jgi:hypothetical protein
MGRGNLCAENARTNPIRCSATSSPTISRKTPRMQYPGYDAFAALLKASGFTGTQLVLISDALREAGLEIRPTIADC